MSCCSDGNINATEILVGIHTNLKKRLNIHLAESRAHEQGMLITATRINEIRLLMLEIENELVKIKGEDE